VLLLQWQCKPVDDAANQPPLQQYNKSTVLGHTMCTASDINCLLMHLVHVNKVPQYFVDSITCRTDQRMAQDTAVYVKPRTRRRFGECGLWFDRPDVWNSLPPHLHCINDTAVFKHKVKTKLL